jgi:hypothetical protein
MMRCRPGTARVCGGPGSAVHRFVLRTRAAPHPGHDTVRESHFFFFALRFFGGGLYTMPSSFMPSGSVK